MDPTLLANVLVPSVWMPYVIEQTAAKSKLWTSGIITPDPVLNELFIKGGDQIQLPFWQDLSGDSETVKTDTDAAIGKIIAAKDIARRQQRMKGWGVEDLAGDLAGSDPLKAIGDRTAAYWAREMQKDLLFTLKGMFADASMADNSHDIYASSGTAQAANMLTGSTFIDSVQKLGDAKDKLTAVLMHSAVEAHLNKLNLIQYFMDTDGKVSLSRIMGHEIIIDDSLTTEVVDGKTVYHTFIFGRGALGYGERTNFSPVVGGFGTWSVEFGRLARRAQSLMITRRDFMLHPRGVKWTEGSVAGEFPEFSELADAANWERVYEAKNIRIVRVRHNIA